MQASFSDLISGNQLVLVDFFADWCGPCKMMSPILQEVKTAVGDRVKIIKINVDTNPELAAKFMVRGVPTLILFKNGNVLWRQSGVASKEDLVRLIKSYV